MSTVSELLSQNVSKIISDVQTWSIFYNALEQGCVGDGTTDDYAALNTLFNQTITTDALVIFPRGSSGYRIASNLTVPSNVVLYFVGEATLKPDTGVTVAINGGIIAGVYQIFSGAGTIIGKPIVEKFFPQWWGAVGDGIANDTSAITAMKNTINTNGGTAFFPKGNYLVTDPTLLTAPAGVTYVGDAALSNFKVGAALTSIPAYSILPTLTASRALVSNGSGGVSASAVTSTEQGYLSGVTGAIQTQFTAKQSVSEKGNANGYASLDSGAKIPIAQIPDSVLGQIEYQGTWNASTNTPTLASPTTVKGYYYVVSVAGTYLTIPYDVGDWIVSNGTIWQKVDNTDAITTVFGRIGAIVPVTNDYTWAQINKAVSSIADITTRSASDLNTGTLPVAQVPTAIPATNIGDGSVSTVEFQFINSLASNAQTQINAKQSLSEKAIANGYASLDITAKIPSSQLPDSIVGQLNYQGVWDASANTPALASPSTVARYYYIVSVAGTYLSVAYNVGDFIISNGTVWEKIDNMIAKVYADNMMNGVIGLTVYPLPLPSNVLVVTAPFVLVVANDGSYVYM